MEEQNGREQGHGSGLFLFGAAVLLVCTVLFCCPDIGTKTADLLRRAEESRPIQAFSALTDSLREGDGVAEAFSESYQVLTRDES